MNTPDKGEPVTLCVDVYEEKIKSYEILGKLRLIIVVRGYLKNKEMIEYTWYTTAPMITIKYFLEDYSKQK